MFDQINGRYIFNFSLKENARWLKEDEQYRRSIRIVLFEKNGNTFSNFTFFTLDKNQGNSNNQYQFTVPAGYFEKRSDGRYTKPTLRIAWYDDIARLYSEYTGTSEEKLVESFYMSNLGAATAKPGRAINKVFMADHRFGDKTELSQSSKVIFKEATISIDNTKHDFESRTVNYPPRVQEFVITNVGYESLEVDNIVIFGEHEKDFTLAGITCSDSESMQFSLLSSEVCTLNIEFLPQLDGEEQATLSIISNDPNTPQLDIPLTGTGIIKEATLNYKIEPNSPFGFGLTEVGHSKTQLLVLSNLGSYELAIDNIVFVPDNGEFSVSSGNHCSEQTPFSLSPSEICWLKLIFSPLNEGNRQATLSIISNDPNEPQTEILLTGIGVFPEPEIETNPFIQTLGENRNDRANSVQQTIDGGYIVAGWLNYKDSVLLSKYDHTGQLEWSKSTGGARNDVANSVQQTVDGGYIIAGYRQNYTVANGLQADILLLKYESTGVVEWTRSINLNGSKYAFNSAHSVQQTSDEGYIVTGDTRHSGSSDIFLLKYDKMGTLEWSKVFGTTIDVYANSVQQTFDGGYIVVGRSSYTDILVLKYDSSGELTWGKTIDGGGYGTAYSVQTTADNGYIIAGQSYIEGKFDILLLKYSAGDQLDWAKVIGGNKYYEARSVHQTTGGGYIITGFNRDDNGIDDAFLLKTDNSGNPLWTKTIVGDKNDRAYSVQQTLDGGYVFAGETESYGEGGDVLLVKTDAAGDVDGCDLLQSISLQSKAISPEINDIILSARTAPLSTETRSLTEFDLSLTPTMQCVAQELSSSLEFKVIDNITGNIQIVLSEPTDTLPNNGTVKINGQIVQANWQADGIYLNLYENTDLTLKNIDQPVKIEIQDANGQEIFTSYYPFVDIEPNQWYSQAIITLWKAGILESNSDNQNQFWPSEPTTREEFIVILTQAIEESLASDSMLRDGRHHEAFPTPSTKLFDDVEIDSDLAPYLQYAKDKGLIQGCDDNNNFCPTNPITRAEAVAVVVIAFDSNTLSAFQNGQQPDNLFQDVTDSNEWYYPHIYAAQTRGWLQDSDDNTFKPEQAITHAEVVTLITLAASSPPLDTNESIDTDGDGINNDIDTDDDNDGMPDTYENQYSFLNPLDPLDTLADEDGDGKINLEEYLQGTAPDVNENNAATVRLVMSSSQSSIQVGENFDITFRVLQDGQKVDGEHLGVIFDNEILHANSVTNSEVLDFVLTSDINNTEGFVTFAVGGFFNPLPTGDFDLFTINFTLKQATDSITLQYDPIQQCRATYEGQYIEQTCEDMTLILQQPALACKVDLQGRPEAPNARWETVLKLSNAVEQEIITDNFGYCELDILPEGEHELCIKNSHTLQNKINFNLPLVADNIDFGLLLEGDVNDNNVIELDDFSDMSTSKDKCQTDTDFNINADLNIDGCVTMDDAILLKSNYLQVGQECSSVRRGHSRNTRDGNDTTVVINTSPIPTNVEVGNIIEFDIKVLAETNINAVAAYLNFSPDKVRINSLKAGESFDFILQNEFDNTLGHINFASGIWENEQPNGIVTIATINATVLETSTEQYFSFNDEFPRLTDASGKNIAEVQTEIPELASATCQLYAVNDKNLNDSQFFTIDLKTNEVNKLGAMYKGHDIEAIAIHPITNMIYAASGDNVTNGKKGYFYMLDGQTGELFPIGYTGFNEIEDLAFGLDGTLWAWAKDDGMITIDLTTGAGKSEIESDIQVEGLTLTKELEQTIFYGSVGTELWMYDMEAEKTTVLCKNLLGETEALEMIPDGLLLMGIDKDKNFSLHAFDANTCQTVVEANILTNQFNDVEGIALPIDACAK